MSEPVIERAEAVSEGLAERAGIADRLSSVLDAVADGITVQDPTGRVVYANATAVRLIGFDRPEELLSATAAEILTRFELFDEAGRPLSVAALPGRRALQGFEDPMLTLRFRVLKTGEDRWAQVRAVPLRDGDGRVAFAINTFHDVTETVRIDTELRASERRYRQLVEVMPQMAWTTDPEGRLTLVNERWAEYTGRPGELGAPQDADSWIHPDDRGDLNDRWHASLATGEPLETASRIRRADGVHRWHLIRAVPLREPDGRIQAWIGTSTDIDEAKRAEESRRFLADASAVLASSLEYEETIRRVAELAVPGMADWCVVDLVGEDGAIEALVVAHVDEAKVALARELRRRFPPGPDDPGGVATVIRTGTSELVSDIVPEMLDALPDPEYRRIIGELGIRSYMGVPLRAGGETFGVISFVGAESGRRYTPHDLVQAENLAARAAAAIQNARLFRDVSRFQQVLEATRDAVYMFDPATLRLTYGNQGILDQVGGDREALLSSKASDFLVDLEPANLRALVAPLIEGRLRSRTVTMTHRHQSGRRLPVEVVLQHLVLPGQPGQIVAVARDMTERVEAQARLQRLAEAEHARAAELNAVIRAMGEGVIVCDPNGRVVLSNPAADDLFGDDRSPTYGDVLSHFEAAGQGAPRLGVADGPVELRIRGDEERWIELSTYPAAARTTAPSGDPETIVLLRDVTAARQRQAVRDTFIGVLSHELRTPVTTIYAGSKVLARESAHLDEATRRSVFDDIHLEAERLHRLVEDVIALTRFGDGPSDIGREPVLLQRLMPGLIASERLRWPGADFGLEVVGTLPPVAADATYVEQVVRNLLSNAAKYAGPEVHVRALVEAAGREVIVRIQDDGPGFPAEEADQLFELYYRSPTTAGTASGAGIGLFVCARLVRAMGGRIWAGPRPEGGAEFAFSLEVMPEE